jgi:alkanesulfonate monooxygenase SsuD/methylene tetrahydromethanopterin reductase-like flavin-dependent oxidoreductase (luciferase family)
MTLTPKPVQQPHPPLLIGARGPNAIRRAAELGAHLMTTLGPDPAPLYIETLQELGRDPGEFKIAQLRMVYCAQSEDQAWEDIQEHLAHVFGYYERVLAEAADVGGVTLDVRRASEFSCGHLDGSINVAHTRLIPRFDEVPGDTCVQVSCATGARAASAASYLARRGVDVLYIDDNYAAHAAELAGAVETAG